MEIAHINLAKGFRGGESQTLALIEALAPAVRQRLVLRRNGGLHRRAAGLENVDLRAVSSSVIAAALAAREASVAHVHEGRSTQAGALLSLGGTPFIVTRRILKPPRSDAVTRWCYGRAAHVVGVSHPVTTVMRAYLDGPPSSTIHDCVPRLERSADAGRIRARAAGHCVAGIVGELDVADKGQDLAIEAARLLAGGFPALRFWIVGKGRDEARLRRLANGLDAVELVGWTDHVADYYGAMSFLVHPARYEPLGSAILEAMSFGLPVVAARTGGIPDIVRHRYNGLLVEPGDAGALAAAVGALAGDAAERERLGRNAAATAAGLTADAAARRYHALYRRLVTAPAGADETP